MTRACKFSFAVAGLCGALLATPAAAQSDGPCAAVVRELHQVVQAQEDYLSTGISLREDREETSKRLVSFRERLRALEKQLLDGLPMLPPVSVINDIDRLRRLVTNNEVQLQRLQADIDTLDRLDKRHEELRQQLATPYCGTTPSAGTTSTATAPDAVVNFDGPGVEPALSLVDAISTAPAVSDVLNYVAPGLPPDGTVTADALSPATATNPPGVLNYVAPGLQNKPPPQTQKQPRVVRQKQKQQQSHVARQQPQQPMRLHVPQTPNIVRQPQQPRSPTATASACNHWQVRATAAAQRAQQLRQANRAREADYYNADANRLNSFYRSCLGGR